MKAKEAEEKGEKEPEKSSTGFFLALLTGCALPPLAAIAATRPAKMPIVEKIYPVLILGYLVGCWTAANAGSTR